MNDHCQKEAIISAIETRQEEMYRRIDRNADWLKEVETLLREKVEGISNDIQNIKGCVGKLANQKQHGTGDRGKWYFWAAFVTSVAAVTSAILTKL